MRILLVEDNEDLGEAIEKRLRSAGHSVEWVKDGAEVVSAAEGDDFDAVALDLMLPNRDGIGLIAELRRHKFNAPILVITARSEIDDKVSLLDLGSHVGELLRRLKTQGGSPGAIVVIADAEASERAVEATALGADDFLQKPFTAKNLALKVGELVNVREPGVS